MNPTLYLAQTAPDWEPAQVHGVALTAADARQLCEDSLAPGELAKLGPWTEPDRDGEQCRRFIGHGAQLEVLVVDLVGATLTEEWRVTGEPGVMAGTDVRFPSYAHTWTPASVERHGDNYGDTPEKAAKGFVAMVNAHAKPWEEGPVAASRVVVTSDWTDADA